MALAVVLIVLAVFVFFLYNNLVKLRVAADGAWSDIEVQLKRRYDLIPNLVETVKGYASHERHIGSCHQCSEPRDECEQPER
jgi:LemA protein